MGHKTYKYVYCGLYFIIFYQHTHVMSIEFHLKSFNLKHSVFMGTH